MAAGASLRVAFYANGYGEHVAANRLRLLQPLANLRALGVAADFYDPARGVEAYDVMVVSRAHTRAAVTLCAQARAAGRPVIYDLCDNLFAGYRSWHDRHRAPLVAEMMRLARIVTTPTRRLADMLQAEVPDAAADYRVVPDALETDTLRRCADVPRRLERLAAFHARHADALHCIWFGSSAKNLAGLAHVDRAAAELQAFSQRHPVTLTVVSDSRWRYLTARRNWRLPVHYQPFSIGDFGPVLQKHRVAVIPVARNAYTAGKSINRPATAILAGLGVIADPIDSYEELRPYIALGNWQAGLERWHATAPADDPHLAAARLYLDRHYGATAVGARWKALIESVWAER